MHPRAATPPLAVLGVLALLAACSDGGGGATPRDAGAPLGDVPCADDAECPSGRCVNLTRTTGLPSGYCALACEENADCQAMGDGRPEHACVDVGGDLGRRCVRTCRDGFGCGLASDLCVPFPLEGALYDVCLDTRRGACTADRDCPEGRFCTPVEDREGVQAICLTPRGPEGGPSPFEPERLRTGAACDPTWQVDGPAATFCNDPSECAGDACYLRSDRQRVCFAPAAERCALVCNPFGQCAGLCDEDADCGAEQRCSRVTAVLEQAVEDAYDDTWMSQGVCTYAAGSRAPCAREADCAATGEGGARETCFPSTDAAGEVRPLCVRPAPGVGLPGEACGDDPATDAVEIRECHGGCESSVCGAVCVDDADCPAGAGCRTFLLDAERSVRFCAKRPDCARDADCAAGEACVPSATATAFEGRCEPALGARAPGAVCRVGEPAVPVPFAERCTLSCLDSGGGAEDGRCTAACAADGDCPPDHACVVEERTLVGQGTLARDDDVTAPLRFCRFLPGRGGACEAAGDCGGGSTCAAWRSALGGAAERRCIAAASGAPLGASCRGDVPCRDRTCFEDWFEPDFPYCTGLCADDGDCGPTLVCRTVTLPDALAGAVRQCIREDDPRGR